MNESCCQFGAERRLAGIVTEPGVRPPRMGIVLISAGLLPKFGPYRLYAHLARRLAEDGIVTLRFDLGGIGDSGQEYEGRPLRVRTEAEVRAAIDYLCERYGFDGVMLGGLCSGAEDAFRVAASDARVTGVVLIDPFAYRTPGWLWRHVLHRLARRAARALGIYEPLVGSRSLLYRAEGEGHGIVTYRYMDRSESSSILRTLLARHASVHFLYTAGMRNWLNHERQLQAAFSEIDFGDRVTVDYLPRLDHTQLLEEDRRAVVEVVSRRLARASSP